MEYVLAIAGSPNRIDAQITKSDGTHVITDSFRGLHFRETVRPLLEHKIATIVWRLCRTLNISTTGFWNQCSMVSFAVSGTDERFDNTLLRGIFERIGFNRVNEYTLRIYGIAEAAYRASLLNKPGVLVRSGAGCSIYTSDKTGIGRLAAGFTTIMGAPGSSYMMVQEVLTIMMKSYDRIASREEDEITAIALSQTNDTTTIEFMERLIRYRDSGGDSDALIAISNLANVLFSNELKNNNCASKIIDSVANHLYNAVCSLINQTKLDDINFTIFYQGTLFESHRAFAGRLHKKITGKYKKAKYIDINAKPIYYARVVGASLLGYCSNPNEIASSSKARRLFESLYCSPLVDSFC